ncbi:MAG: aminodeoxychorismate lyase [Gammaproteobacteria bacterium]
MILVNGEPNETLPVTDRGLQYGDGLFETIEVRNRKPVFFVQHLNRLEDGCRRLGLPFPPAQILIEEAKTLCRLASPQAVLKIIVTSGSGGRGYRRPDPMQTTRILSLHPFPDYPAAYATAGVRLKLCRTRLGINPALAGIKHLNRLEQVLARSEWNAPDIQEGLMLDASGNVIEGTMTNLFYIKDRTLYTASLAETGIAGITRANIMILAKENRLDVHELTYQPEQLFSADEVFVCNSIIGIWPARQIDQFVLPVGSVTRQLQQGLAELKHEAFHHD